jgi:hypothetical protein
MPVQTAGLHTVALLPCRLCAGAWPSPIMASANDLIAGLTPPRCYPRQPRPDASYSVAANLNAWRLVDRDTHSRIPLGPHCVDLWRPDALSWPLVTHAPRGDRDHLFGPERKWVAVRPGALAGCSPACRFVRVARRRFGILCVESFVPALQIQYRRAGRGERSREAGALIVLDCQRAGLGCLAGGDAVPLDCVPTGA